MKPIKQRNSEDIALEIEKELKNAIEYELDYVLKNLELFKSTAIVEDNICYAIRRTDSLFKEYHKARIREAVQEKKTGEEAYQQAIGL